MPEGVNKDAKKEDVLGLFCAAVMNEDIPSESVIILFKLSPLSFAELPIEKREPRFTPLLSPS